MKRVQAKSVDSDTYESILKVDKFDRTSEI